MIADPILVDPKFGTGAVKVTPAHDPNDFECGQRHKLGFISIFDEKGVVTAEGGPFAGLDRFEARKQVKAKITELGLERGSKPHVHAIGHCQRCHTVVEPMLSTQWFVKMEPLAKPAIEAVEQGKTRFVPESWSKTYFHWMNNIRDWCISRQLWWGHRIPAWYCASCAGITVARTTPAAVQPLRGREPQAGRGRARYLVLVVAVALRDPGLARRDTRSAHLLPHQRDGDRLRHPVLLGGPHDDGRASLHEEGSLPHGVPAHHGDRREGREDGQGQGQHHRPSRCGAEARGGSLALRAGLDDHPGRARQEHQVFPVPSRGRAALRQQDLERDPLCLDESHRLQRQPVCRPDRRGPRQRRIRPARALDPVTRPAHQRGDQPRPG